MPYRVPNWDLYQGYKKRGPPWVKLHVALLRKLEWIKLPTSGKALLPALWIIASESGVDGSLPDDHEVLSHLSGIVDPDLSEGINALISFRFIESDKSVARSATKVSGEIERETEERERQSRCNARVAPGNGAVTDAALDQLDADIAFEESRFNRLALEIGQDRIQAVLDSLPRPKSVGAFSASRWLATGLCGIGRSEPAMIRLRLTCDALEAWQRAKEAPKKRKGPAPAWDRAADDQADIDGRAVAWVDARPVPMAMRSDIQAFADEAPADIRAAVAAILIARNPGLRETA